jgi:hypothetical protein
LASPGFGVNTGFGGSGLSSTAFSVSCTVLNDPLKLN